MSKLKKEAVGQYNYLAATPAVEQNGRKKPKHSYPDFYPHTDVTVEIVDPKTFKLFKMKPPTMFESSYHQDYRHPPAENFVGQRPHSREKYTAYVQTSPAKLPAEEKPNIKPPVVPKVVEEQHDAVKRTNVKSANAAEQPKDQSARPPIAVARAHTAEPKKRSEKESKVNTEFYRAVLKARKGTEWNRPPDVSYDVLNPEKPNPERATKPYGANMENVQEQIATGAKKSKGTRPSTVGSSRAPSQAKRRSSAASIEIEPVIKLDIKSHTPQVSRASTASGRSSGADSRYIVTRVKQKRPTTSDSSLSSIGDDYFLETGRHLNETLETIQEEEILEQLEPKSPQPEKRLEIPKAVRGRKSRLKKPIPPVDLFKRKGPDPRFYASKKNLRTPNEMQRFKKARNRTYMRNVEQAVPELDFKDHEVKYQPERQLFQDARWRIRQDVKDVHNKNTHSLVDRFGKRQEVIKEEQRTRLGDPTYIGRDPVSVYKLQDAGKGPEQQPKLGFQVTYPLHNRRRITPSMGSVQRARNLGSHAQIFNQPCAPPHWGPQKVDHSLFLPPMAQKI